MGFRLAEGLSLEQRTQEFGANRVSDLQRCLAPYCRTGWVAYDENPTPIVRFTDPEGFLFSNVVLVKLFETFSDPQ